MMQFVLGAVAALVVNALTLLGWIYVDPWVPSAVNVGLALGVLGYYGLEDRWAFPLGYWVVELLAVGLWLSGMSIGNQLMGG